MDISFIELALGQKLVTSVVDVTNVKTWVSDEYHLNTFVCADSVDPSLVSRVMTQEPTEDAAGVVTRGVYERESLNRLESIDHQLRRAVAAMLILLDHVAPSGHSPGVEGIDQVARQL